MRVLTFFLALVLFSSCVHVKEKVKPVVVPRDEIVKWDESRRPKSDFKVLLSYEVSSGVERHSGKAVFESIENRCILRIYSPLNQLILYVVYTDEGTLVRGDLRVYRMIEGFDCNDLKDLLYGYLNVRSREFKGFSEEGALFSDNGTLTVFYPYMAVVKNGDRAINFYYKDGKLNEVKVVQGCCKLDVKILKLEEM